MKCIIVEDDGVGRLQLKKLLEEIGGLELLGEAVDCESGSALVSIHSDVELLLLDVELPDGTAFDLVERLEAPPKIIFITNFDVYALRAFEINALDYIRKPLTRSRFESALERLEGDSVPVAKSGGRLVPGDLILMTESRRKYFTRVSDLLAVESDDNYTHVLRIDGKRFVVKKSLAAWEAQLPSALFRKIGRSLIVNLSMVDRMERTKRGGALWFQGRKEPIQLTYAAMNKLQQLARAV